jgi:hypothetical protein
MYIAMKKCVSKMEDIISALVYKFEVNFTSICLNAIHFDSLL